MPRDDIGPMPRDFIRWTPATRDEMAIHSSGRTPPRSRYFQDILDPPTERRREPCPSGTCCYCAGANPRLWGEKRCCQCGMTADEAVKARAASVAKGVLAGVTVRPEPEED